MLSPLNQGYAPVSIVMGSYDSAYYLQIVEGKVRPTAYPEPFPNPVLAKEPGKGQMEIGVNWIGLDPNPT